LSVDASFDVPVAAVALSVTWNPEKLSLLAPVLTPRSDRLALYYGLKPGELTCGMLDTRGAETIEAGAGPIVILRFVPRDRQEVDLTSVRIQNATLVNQGAQDLRLRMVR
jgi:hypothetical protein